MINLLPPQTKENILYARRNTKLRNWISVLLIALAGIVVIVVVGQLYLSNVSRNLQAQVKQGKANLQTQAITQTQERVEDISSSLKLVLQVLSRQVLFSKLLQQIGSVMPPGAALSDLSITAVQGGIDLRADAVDYQTATQVLINFQDPDNKIFSKADLINISCSDGDDDGYPCTITIRAQFSDSNNFTFLSTNTGETQ